ncbi:MULTISPECIES: hypothetical protein [unclassified Acinetobacter]|uniref:hypothetical protein n=1 Tax=unclassified Acinetobacter TaxID=196816 RepID=UPI002934DC6E|nr:MULTISPECIES: hypothetical protein [unclassified Acinetobacter]WOE31637.1 hypothetical protein QSG84_15260 [Acinetobacter sp. SAAs470]WOE37102.1 hypothetical protein QSG86_08925 [Acinetobacter sp. SAAs474]
MRYKIIDVYKSTEINSYIAKCLKQHSPQFIIIESTHTLCLNLDIIDVDHQLSNATWATGEEIALKVLNGFDSYDKTYMSQS